MKYSKEYLLKEFGVIDMTEEIGYYMVPCVHVNTDEELYDGDIANIYDFDLSNLVISDNDTIIVTCFNDKGRIWMFNTNNLSEGFFTYNGSLYDDGRYYLINTLANKFKKYNNVNFEMYLYYTADETERYVDRLILGD